MKTLALVLIALIALEHIYILYLEMFAWTTKGPKVFKGSLSPEMFPPTRTLAANQGLYNGFLAAGLAYGVATGSREFCLFFLACVVVAGLYGAYSVSRRIFLVQAVPALLAIAAVLLLR